MEPYPVYSETQLNDTNLTRWNKPWPPEINWLDFYVNLSSLSEDVLEGLFIGFTVTKHAKYLIQSHTGCWMEFHFDVNLTKAHYMKHYANKNKTMILCRPNVPMRPDVYRDWTEHHYSLISCIQYELGALEELYGQGNWIYIWKSDKKLELSIAFSTAMLIILLGLVGKYNKFSLFI